MVQSDIPAPGETISRRRGTQLLSGYFHRCLGIDVPNNRDHKIRTHIDALVVVSNGGTSNPADRLLIDNPAVRVSGTEKEGVRVRRYGLGGMVFQRFDIVSPLAENLNDLRIGKHRMEHRFRNE